MMSEQTKKPRAVLTILHVLAGLAIFIAVQTLASLVYLVPSQPLAHVLFAFVNIALLLGALQLYGRKVMGVSLQESRVQRPRSVLVWIIPAIALPLIVSAVYLLLVPGQFSYGDLSSTNVISGIFYAVFVVGVSAGVSEELLFRGFIMSALERQWGKPVAVLMPSILFGLLHVTSMQQSNFLDFAMLLIAGTLVGVMFSLIALQSNSIWPGALVHGLWNLVIIGGILDIGTLPSGSSLFTYMLYPDFTLITGGAFGIEAGLPAILMYAAMALLAFFLYKRQRAQGE